MTASPDDLERLYRDRFVGFKRALATVTGDYGSAEEALQEGFARALASLETFRGDCPLAAWVWRIAVRVALEHQRAKRPRLPFDHDAVWLPATELVERGHNPGLVDALRSLPPRRRLIVFLRYFADCSYTEIASICEISEGTVAASLAQSRTVLAKSLGVEQAETTKEVGR